MSPTLVALKVAVRHMDADSTTEQERDAILAALATHCDGPEGEAASRALHHRREARAHQMQLAGLLARKEAA